MKISFAKPPIWDEANKLFKLEELNLGTIFTYGDTLFNPFRVEITNDLVAHEEVHARQQQWDNTVAGLWWKRYLADPQFRVEQEAEAYGAQYKCICGEVHDRNAQARRLNRLAQILSGEMYGRAVTHRDAMLKIKKCATIK